MAYGRWGSRFPIGNILFSAVIFAVVGLRIGTKQLMNRIKTRLRPKAIKYFNDESATEMLRMFVSNGYDKLNIGGGRKSLGGFVNIDFIPNENVERQIVANICDLSFIPTACATHIHSNHVLEHLTDEQLIHQLNEYARILKNSGLLTIRCPNALGASYAFWFDPVIEEDRDEFVSLGFPVDEDLCNSADTWGHKDIYGFLHWIYGDMGNIENQHLNIITPSKIKRHIERSGYRILKMSDPEAVNIVVIAVKE